MKYQIDSLATSSKMKKEISNDLQEALKYNLSFAGCGFLGIYHGKFDCGSSETNDFTEIIIFN